MAITPTVLTSGKATGGSPHSTSSISPSANTSITVAVSYNVFGGGTLGTPSISGNGITWTQIAQVDFSTIATPTYRLTLWYGYASSPSSGAITISVSGGSSDKAFTWEVVQWDGADTTGFAVQSNTNRTDGSSSPNALTVTLPSAITSGNAVYAVFGDGEDTTSLSPSTGYTQLTQINDGSGQDNTLFSEWKSAGTTTPGVSGATAFQDQGGIAVEVGAAGGGTTYFVTLSATSTSTATIVKDVEKIISVTSSSVATLIKKIAKSIVASSTSILTLAPIKATLKTLTASSTSIATIAKQANKIISVSSSSTASIVKDVSIALVAISSSTSSIVKQPQKILKAISTSTATIATVKLYKVTLTAISTNVSTITKTVEKIIVTTSSSVSTISKKVAKTLTATSTSIATLIAVNVNLTRITTTVSASLTFVRQVSKSAVFTQTVSTVENFLIKLSKFLNF